MIWGIALELFSFQSPYKESWPYHYIIIIFLEKSNHISKGSQLIWKLIENFYKIKIKESH